MRPSSKLSIISKSLRVSYMYFEPIGTERASSFTGGWSVAGVNKPTQRDFLVNLRELHCMQSNKINTTTIYTIPDNFTIYRMFRFLYAYNFHR